MASSRPNPHDLVGSIGQVIGERYRLEALLGRGGMGEVWRAVHLVTRRPAALKLLRHAQTHDASARLRFLREARATSAVNHPNVAEVVDAFESDGGVALVMPLFEGETLGARLAREAPLGLSAALDILLPLIAGVEAAHAHGVVHRDLKPDNVFLANIGGKRTVKVLDFGIAKLVGDDPTDNETLTGAGTMLGTPCYMAPEQGFAEPDQDHRVDIWAIGVIAYEMLSATRPIEGENAMQIMRNLLTQGITPLALVAPTVPLGVSELVMRMLTRERIDRPQSLREVFEALRAFRGAAPPEAAAQAAAVAPASVPETPTLPSEPPAPHAAVAKTPVHPSVSGIKKRAEALLGRTLRDKWRLEQLLGLGGMAAVYAATHRNGNRAAIKILHAEAALVPDIRTRFLREGYLANQVQHPGAVAILDDDVDEDGTTFLVMELLEGETVEVRCDQAGRLAADEVLLIAYKVLDVLAAAHAKQIIHRDLKPANLFLERTGGVKVLDFGIARLRSVAPRPGATGSGTTLGTPAFMPPEQARGNWDEVDGRSDLWALGATMYALLSGEVVHEDSAPDELLLRVMTKPARPLLEVVPGVPSAVAAVVDRALRFEKSERWPDASAMRGAVKEAYATLKPEGISLAPPIAVTARSRSVMPNAPTLLAPEPGKTSTNRPVGRSASPSDERSRRPWLWPAIVVGGIASAGFALHFSGSPEPAHELGAASVGPAATEAPSALVPEPVAPTPGEASAPAAASVLPDPAPVVSTTQAPKTFSPPKLRPSAPKPPPTVASSSSPPAPAPAKSADDFFTRRR